jgi:dephospho-CoA kinase
MTKRIFIVNGMARAGKDTFADILKELVPGVGKTSSINAVKEIAKVAGWDGGKTEKDRKFLSDLKCLLTEYDDIPFKYIIRSVSSFYTNLIQDVLLIDIREPDEITRAKIAFNARTILIKNNRVQNITSNMADAGVFNYNYDITINNNGTLEEFRENIKDFVREELGIEPKE